MYILGIHSSVHDSAACLLKNGFVISAAEEERFDKKKHSGAFPLNAIRYCLNAADVSMSNVEAIGLSYKPSLIIRNALSHFAQLTPHRVSLRDRYRLLVDELDCLHKLLITPRRLTSLFNGTGLPKVHFIEHHLAHAASAFLVSPYERAAILTIDGYGEDTSTLLSTGNENKIQEVGHIRFPSSIGLLYNAITKYLGFQSDCEEGSVMALASFGTPTFIDLFRKILITDRKSWKYTCDQKYLDHSGQSVSNEFVRIMGPPRRQHDPITSYHRDIAASLQKVVEEACVNIATQLYLLTGMDTLCMAGGVALNCAINGKIVRETPFKRFFFQPASGDAGTAIGCSSYIYHVLMGFPRTSFVMDSVYLGPEFDQQSVTSALQENGLQYMLCRDVAKTSANLLAKGKILGWFQGRLEFGPRALGNRSILADPRNPATKKMLNCKIKGREDFRPFGPSVKIEAAREFFECAGPHPYMIVACRVRPERIEQIPSAVHVDGTARIQTVSKEVNPLFWKVLDEFEKKTGVPILLNTSFNRKGEPIVSEPRDAIRTFLLSNLDYLVIGNYLVRKTA